MRNDAILARIAEAADAETAIGDFLFHGSEATPETFAGEPKPGAYDDVFWTARNPAVAQTYIPSASTTLLSCHELNERVRPTIASTSTGPRPEGWYALALQLGYPAAIAPEYDAQGRVKSWGIPDGYPRYRDLVEKLVEWGYPADGRGFSEWVKCTFVERDERFLPADYRSRGSLVIVDGWQSLKLYDLYTGREGDLTSPDYNRLGLFRKLEDAGYDGVRIHDFCQTREWGNVGHEAVGFFAHAIPRLTWTIVPAQRFEWEDDISVAVTPEFASLLARPAEVTA